MKLWGALILFLIAVVCIVVLAMKMRTAERKTAYIVGIVLLSLAAIALLGYIALTVFFVNSIT